MFPTPLASPAADVEHLDVERADRRPLDHRIAGAAHPGLHLPERHRRIASKCRGGRHEKRRDRGGERDDPHEGRQPRRLRSDRSDGNLSLGRSRSYARTHLRTALSLTPYLRPTADQLVAAISSSNCSYGGRSTRRAPGRIPHSGPSASALREQYRWRSLFGRNSSPQCGHARSSSPAVLPTAVRVERRGTVRADDSEVLEPVVVGHAVDVVEDQRHPPAAPFLALPAELAPPLLEAVVVEALLEMTAAVRRASTRISSSGDPLSRRHAQSSVK